MKLKFKRTNETIILNKKRTLYRIKTLVDFGNIKAGTKGGYVEFDENLSHDGLCWIADKAMAYGHSRVSGNGLLKDRAVIKDYVCVHGNGIVCGEAYLNKSVHVFDNGAVGGQSFLTGAATVSGNAVVYCTTLDGIRRFPNMQGLSIITDSARLEERGRLKGSATLRGNTLVRGHAFLTDRVVAGGNIVIGGAVHISDDVQLLGTVSLGGSCRLRGKVAICGKPGGLRIAGPSLLLCNTMVYGRGELYGIHLSGDEFYFATEKEAA